MENKIAVREIHCCCWGYNCFLDIHIENGIFLGRLEEEVIMRGGHGERKKVPISAVMYGEESFEKIRLEGGSEGITNCMKIAK